LIYQIAIISSFIILIILFLLSTFLYSLCKKNIKENLKQEKVPIPQKKLGIIKNLVLIFISLLILIKLTIFLFSSNTILTFDPISPGEIDFLIITFFYAVFWVIILFSILITKEMKDEYLIIFFKKISTAIIVLFFLDFCLAGIVYILNIKYYLDFAISNSTIKILSADPNTSILLSIILLLLIILAGLFSTFILKRKIRILRYYELTILLLLSIVGYLVMTGTSNLIGWNESAIFRLKLFSFDYGYVGLVFLFLLAVTLITNSFVILLFNSRKIFINSQMIKNRIVNNMKIGFISTLALCGLAVMPFILIWFS
jgi:hypothetical protein